MTSKNIIPFAQAARTLFCFEADTIISRWEQVEAWKPFIHEAGHAVVARVLGFPVAWVSMDQSFINADPLSRKNECTDSGPTCMTISSARLEPIVRRRGIRTLAEKEVVLGYCMHVLAGPDSEWFADPSSFDPLPSTRDLHQVAQMLMTVEPHAPTRKKLFRMARRRLVASRRENWKGIVAVAEALRQRSTLSGPEIDAVLANSALKVAA